MIDLKTFCSKTQYRIEIQQPFSRGDYTYATDGRVAVRVPRLADIPERDGAPDVEKLFSALPESCYAPINVVGIAGTTAGCIVCEGRGTKHDCPSCTCDCDACNGTGQTDKWPSIGIDGVPFNGKFIKQLMTLPGLVMATAEKDKPVHFRFDGGEGLLMPLRWKSDEHIEVR